MKRLMHNVWSEHTKSIWIQLVASSVILFANAMCSGFQLTVQGSTKKKTLSSLMNICEDKLEAIKLSG